MISLVVRHSISGIAATVCMACLHVRDFGHSQHSADKKSRQHVVVAHPFSKPDLDLHGPSCTIAACCNQPGNLQCNDGCTLTKSYLEAVCLASTRFDMPVASVLSEGSADAHVPS